ncbi:hypothetical protein BH10CYA1_BH10CYA1_11540 [soil metagenome]
MAPPKFDSFAKGQELATKAEHEPLAAVNNDLAQMRKLHPKEFGAIIKSMEGANIVHLSDDQNRVNAELRARTSFDKWLGKPEPTLTVPKLTIEGDDRRDKFKNPTHVTAAVLPSLEIVQNSESTSKSTTKALIPTGGSSFETGNYSNTAQGQEDAFNDITNPSRHNKKK